MTDRCFYNADGEMLIVPQQGRARFVTELGVIEAAPRRDRGDPARLALSRRAAGRPVARLHLRELRRACCGCRSSARSAPTVLPIRAIFSRRSRPTRTRRRRRTLVAKFQGNLWAAEMDHSPLNVVAWHGNFAPYKYDLARFNVHRHDQLRSSRSVDLHRADRAVGHCRAPPTSISSSSRRAGSSARIRSGRRGSTATS